MSWRWLAMKKALVDAWNPSSRFLIAILLLCLSVMPVSAQTPETPSDEPNVTHQPEVFERLWKIYPNKSNRPGAIEAWNNLKVSDEELYKMRLAYPQWRFSSQWTTEGGRHVPPLATFLGDRMWEKEPPPQAPPTVKELSSFLIQPLYLGPRLVYAISGALVGVLVYPLDKTAGKKVWDSSFGAPWVWHEFIGPEL